MKVKRAGLESHGSVKMVILSENFGKAIADCQAHMAHLSSQQLQGIVMLIFDMFTRRDMLQAMLELDEVRRSL